jgi:conjugative relaxase-like TrwC/TraI family protein
MVFGKDFRNTANYSERHLSQNDYYEKGKTVTGYWYGQACEGVGIQAGSPVNHKDFERLRKNEHAVTGEQVTLRMNTTRMEWVVDKETGKLRESHVSNRREFYDFTLNAPKTFSVLAVTAGDDRVRQWHDRAVRKTIAEMERLTSRRVHGGPDTDHAKTTGQLIAAWYKHDANRCLEPQLHDHFVVMNMTPDDDGKHYALDARAWMDRCRYLTAVYRDVLAHEARASGLEIVLDKYGAPQIKAIVDLVEVFSRRSAEIESLVEKVEEVAGTTLTPSEVKAIVFASRGIDIAEFNRDWATNRKTLEAMKELQGPAAEADILRRSMLDAFTKIVRKACKQGMAETTTPEVIAAQLGLLSPDQCARLSACKEAKPSDDAEEVKMPIHEAVRYAIDHCFERRSVVKDHELWQAAIERFLGEDVDLEALRRAMEESPELIAGRAHEVTTREHLARELDLIGWVKDGKGQGKVISAEGVSEMLKLGQKGAVLRLLASEDQYTCLVGKAGSGKTRSLTEVVAANLRAGHRVLVTAPSNSARDVLRGEVEDMAPERREDGTGGVFQKAESLQMFLASPCLQNEVFPGDLVILDEAGFASVEDVHRLMAFARKKQCRVLFSGDPRQHSSVAAGDALRVMLKRTELDRANLFEIVRQRPDALSGLYLQAAKLFSEGKTTAAFARLDEADVITELKGRDRVQTIAEEIVKEHEAGRSVIAVNPSHRENDLVNAAVRDRLTAKGLLRDHRTIQAYRSLGWTHAERRDVNRIQPGMIIEVTRGGGKGSAWAVVRVEQGKAHARDVQGRERVFTRAAAGSFDVCERRELEVAVGDKLITRAGVRSPNGEIINGERITVSGFDAQGNVMSDQGKLITTKNLAHSYAMTSHRSQGDTADAVLVGMDRHSIRWVCQKLAYVAATRGRAMIRVFVENKADLTQVQARTGERKAATDLVMVAAKDQKARELMEEAQKVQAIEQASLTANDKQWQIRTEPT